MGQIVYYVAASLDGFIAGPNGDVSWLDEYSGPDEDYGYQEFLDSVDTLVMGSLTYEKILEFGEWPYPGKSTYVATKRELPAAEGAEIKFSEGPISTLIDEIKRGSAADIWLVGGGALAGDMLAQGLLDKVRLFVMPVLLGGGVPLFSGLKETARLNPAEMTRYESGVVGLDYTAGP